MFVELEDLGDDVPLCTEIPSRPLSDTERAYVSGYLDGWLVAWERTYPECPVARPRWERDGRVLLWAIDERPRRARLPEKVSDLTGTDLDPLVGLFWDMRSWDPPIWVESTLTLEVDGDLVPFGSMLPPQLGEDPLGGPLRRAVEELERCGRLTPQTPIIHRCTVGEWRSGRLAHPLAACDRFELVSGHLVARRAMPTDVTDRE